MITNKLVNPTHKDVKIPWDKGVNIFIPADSQIEVTLEQMDDFRPGKPGSEEVSNIMKYHGVFLLDADRSYDEQAMQALQATFQEKRSQLAAFMDRLRDGRIATGSPVDEASMKEAKERSGYDKLEEDIKKIQLRIDFLRAKLGNKGFAGKVKETIDPRKTCFATEPPRQFPSESALELFLLDKPEEFVMKHKNLQTQMLGEA